MEDKNGIDVLVIGGGLAGLATSIHLARAGLSVTCVQSDEFRPDLVGESLDWSAPDLLKGIGVPVDMLMQRGIATSKQHVMLRLLNGSERHYVPATWLAGSPFNVSLDTIHVDRDALAQIIRDVVERELVQMISDQVIRVEQKAGRIISVATKHGLQLHARWFVDASGGTTRLFARTFSLPSREYGPGKVAMWDYFSTTGPTVDGTILYCASPTAKYMDWIWQIPIRNGLLSVGYVSTGETIKQQRQSGLDVPEIYEARLREFPALGSLLTAAEQIAPRVTSFRCRVHKKVSGPNWLIVGEAASMVDPMTSNGATAALRHAQEAAALLIRSRNASRLPRMAAAAYAWRVNDVSAFFNSLIENIVYEASIRARVGGAGRWGHVHHTCVAYESVLLSDTAEGGHHDCLFRHGAGLPALHRGNFFAFLPFRRGDSCARLTSGGEGYPPGELLLPAEPPPVKAIYAFFTDPA